MCSFFLETTYLTEFFLTLLGSAIGSCFGYLIARSKYKFESLHTKRFVVLEEIYQKLVAVHEKAVLLLHVEASLNEERLLADLYSYHDMLFDTQTYVKTKAIFLSKSERKQMDKFFNVVKNFENNLGYKKLEEMMGGRPQLESGKVIQEMRDGVFKTLPTVLSEIENDFKKSLGL